MQVAAARKARSATSLLAALVLVCGSCGARSAAGFDDWDGGATDAGAGGSGAGADSGGAAGVGGLGGSPCETAGGVRLCGGNAAACGWIGVDACPGGGCARPHDRILGGNAIAGLCFSDLPDNGSRSCLECEDGEVCIERYPDELVCVPADVCAKLWNLGARGVCRYADLTAYDARPLPSLSTCPSTNPEAYLCGGPCPSCKSDFPTPCTGRSPDHPQGFCSYDWPWCALDAAGYVESCKESERYCGVFRTSPEDFATSKMYGRCMGISDCLTVSKVLPGGFDCFDEDAQLVTSAPSG